MPQLIQLTQICKEYPLGGGTVIGLDHVNLTVRQGEYLAIVGHSGSGKSTLMNILGCLDLPSAGEYRFYSQQLGPVKVDRSLGDRAVSRLRNREIGFVFQSFQLIPQLTALENVELPLRYRGLGASRRRELALQALEQVGLGGRTGHFPGQLSGGQQQRVAVARAVAANPPLILADEPTGNLDRRAAEEVALLLQRLHREGKTVVLITHDEELARSAPRRVRIEGGRLYAEAGELCADL